MKISQEAREAAEAYWEGTRHSEFNLAAAMQSLINSTLETAQAVADEYEGTAANERCDDPQAAAACDISEAIGKLISV